MTESIFWQDHEKNMTNPDYAQAYYETLEEIKQMMKEDGSWSTEDTGSVR